jgi:hypothetical protein
MKKKSFKHECKLAFNGNEGKRKKKSLLSKPNDIDNNSVKDIYNRYYKNQLAALYNAVKDY